MAEEAAPSASEKLDTNLAQLDKVLNMSQTAIAAAGALGLVTIGRTAWSRATRTYDKRLLVEFDKHAASLERAEAIRNPPGNKPPEINSHLDLLAKTLEEQAHERLRYAIAHAQWQNSKIRNGAGGLGAASCLMLVLAIFAGMFGWRLADSGWLAETDNLVAGFVAIAMALLFCCFVGFTVGRSVWLGWTVKKMKPSADSPAKSQMGQ